MNIKAFFVDALTAALDLNIGTPEDVLRHVTPDVLSVHLPRPLWARLLTACLGAPRVEPRLVVETIGIANLCEHVPSAIIWSCIADIGERSLGKTTEVSVPAGTMQMTASGRSIIAPPPEAHAVTATPSSATPVAMGPSIPAPASPPIGDVLADLEQTDEARVSRPRTSTSQRFRQSSTAISRGSNSRRPQAMATPVPPAPLPRVSGSGRRVPTEVTVDEPETHVTDWGQKEIAVDDSQLVDWQTDVGGSSAITGDDDFSDLGSRKR